MLTQIIAALVFLLVPVAGVAQTPKVGILVPELDRPQSQSVKGIKKTLQQLGFHERDNILIELRDAKGNRAGLEPAVKELVAVKANVIVTTGTRATRLAKTGAPNIPIVFIHPGDPVELGLVKTANAPGENITGVAGFASQTTEKRMAILKDILPGLRLVHVFYDANNQFSRANYATAKAAAEKLRLEVAEHGIKSSDELKASVSQLDSAMDEAIFHMPDDLVESDADSMLATLRKKRLPSMFNDDVWAIKGAMAAYGPSNYDMGRQAARLVEAILKGRKAETLPVQPAMKFDLTLNYRTARFIGVTLPPELVKKADRVIR